MHLSNLFMISTKQQNDLKHKLCPHTQQMIYRWVCTIKNGFFPRILKECVVRAASSTVYVAMQYVCVLVCMGLCMQNCVKKETPILWQRIEKLGEQFPKANLNARKLHFRILEDMAENFEFDMLFDMKMRQQQKTRIRERGGAQVNVWHCVCLALFMFACIHTFMLRCAKKKHSHARTHKRCDCVWLWLWLRISECKCACVHKFHCCVLVGILFSFSLQF